MNGIKEVHIKNNRVDYKIVLKRNITIVKGDSGTGKSNLVKMVRGYNPDVKNATKIYGNAKVKVLPNCSAQSRELVDAIKSSKNTILIADENLTYTNTREFAKEIYGSGSYLLFITREKTAFLEYAVDSICTMKSSKKGIYENKLEYIFQDKDVDFNPDIVITEDSGVGGRVISKALGRNVETSNGKNNVINKIKESVRKGYRGIYCIVDGSAFGRNIEGIVRYIKLAKEQGINIGIFAPESFEWLCLNTNTVKSRDEGIEDKITYTEDYIDYMKYSSWERFYTDLLREVMKKYFKENYTKSGEIPNIMRKDTFLKEIRSQFKDLK